MALLKFGVNSKKHWFFLLGSITLIFRTNLPKNDTVDEKLKLLFMGIGMVPALLCELISQKCLSNSKRVKHKSQTWLQYFQMLGIYFIIALLDSSGFAFSINRKSQKDMGSFHGKEHIQYMVQFVVAAILSYIFLNKRLHKHHKFFSVMMALGMVIIVSSNLLAKDNHFQLEMLYLLVDGFAYGIILVLAKWLMEYKFISAYEIVGYDGLFSVIIAVIAILTTGIKTNELDDGPFFIVSFAVAFAVLTFGYAIFIFLVVQHFGETHRVVMDLLSFFIMHIINIIRYKDLVNLIEGIVLFVGYFIVLIGVIGYNEILVFSCFDLNYDTAIEIDKRCTEIPAFILSDKGEKKSTFNDGFSESSGE